ncbi:MAG: recombinase RecT [Myxococcales bacterium]|nr:recombinase RecT [Myxococcales bacterium]
MAGPTTDARGQIVPRSKQVALAPADQLAGLIMRMGPELGRALPKHVNPERMARIVLTAIRMNPDLARCSQQSFLGSVLTAAQLGLEVNTPLGQAYLIPYKGVCTLIVGYQGMIELARRSGHITNLYAYAVRAGDKFSFRYGLNRDLQHEPSEEVGREKQLITHVYAVARQRTGDPDFVVLTKAEVDARRARSHARNNGPWVTDEEAMTLKTSVRALFKWLPKSTELQRALMVDEADDASSQAAAWDPEITDILDKQGVEPTPAIPAGDETPNPDSTETAAT